MPGTATTKSSSGGRAIRADRGNGAGSKADGAAASSDAGPSNGAAQPPHAFELVVLGSGGGPLETDCSGYLLKPLVDSWEKGLIALEGGSGLGALSTILTLKSAAEVFPDLDFPESHNSPVLKAAYIFSHLTCYLLTHAHLDHALSLVMLSGSIPPKPPSLAPVPVDPGPPKSPAGHHRIPVYATRDTLECLAEAYDGRLWPELGKWAQEKAHGRGTKRKLPPVDTSGVGVMFSPLTHAAEHRPLHPTLPITTLTFPVAHGHSSHGLYTSSAMFIRYDPSTLDGTYRHGRPAKDWRRFEEGGGAAGREFLFFGDLESGWRRQGEEHIDVDNKREADALNRPIWEEAAKRLDQGLLAGIFIECSYDSSRPIDLMYGHLCPPSLYHELRALASLVRQKPRPLDGLRIFVTHIKEQLVPHASGLSARERIKMELDELEAADGGGLGVSFVIVQPGDRILI